MNGPRALTMISNVPVSLRFHSLRLAREQWSCGEFSPSSTAWGLSGPLRRTRKTRSNPKMTSCVSGYLLWTAFGPWERTIGAGGRLREARGGGRRTRGWLVAIDPVGEMERINRIPTVQAEVGEGGGDAPKLAPVHWTHQSSIATALLGERFKWHACPRSRPSPSRGRRSAVARSFANSISPSWRGSSTSA
jgi:hypothetical protein